ncbi:MAG: alpha/beta hydrolase [Candidatus Brocadiia bacterium]
MTRLHPLLAAALAFCLGAAAPAAARKPMMKPTRTLVYKTVKDAKLRLHVFEPEGHRAADRRPAIVFFFGGGWVGGTPAQFMPQCAYLASRGMVAISAEYRVRNRHGVTPYACVRDGKSAVRWLRAHAAELGIDPERLAAGGGSAGAHVAACTGVVEGMEEEGEDAAVSSRPDALVLFNPPLVLDFDQWARHGVPAGRVADIRRRFEGGEPRSISPTHHVGPGEPPTLVLHGEADATVPIATARAFAEAMRKQGNRCELAAYEGEGHGFFNLGRGEAFFLTLRRADRFLASLGWLEGEDTVEAFRASLGRRP